MAEQAPESVVMFSNRRSATERSKPFSGLNNGGGNINSGFGQILPKRNCSSRTDIQNKLHEYPFQGSECLRHRRCNPHLPFTVQAGTPLHRSQRAQRMNHNTTRYYSAWCFCTFYGAMLHREPPPSAPLPTLLSRPGPTRQAVTKEKGLHTGRYDLVRLRSPSLATNRGRTPD